MRSVKVAVVFSLAVVAVIGAYAPAPAKSAAARACAPPRGPGDNLVHSKNLHVKNITCKVGRTVALACTRFTYGHAGTCAAAGRRWHCTSTKPAGSESFQQCKVGRREMSILWLD
jgi:hypothetical protein